VAGHARRRSGDYKRSLDPGQPFELVSCDLFITEAPFGLPVFRHEPAEREAARLVASLRANPERTHLLGVYGLGKCQRMIMLGAPPATMRRSICGACGGVQLYERLGYHLGELKPVTEASADELKGALVLCPPSSVDDRWSRRFSDPMTCFASGWMRVKGRARQRGVELPLIVSDHCDWPELLRTIEETGAEDIWDAWREDALVCQIGKWQARQGAGAVGFEDEGG
jgi:putative mRNA 3-end processing factor